MGIAPQRLLAALLLAACGASTPVPTRPTESHLAALRAAEEAWPSDRPLCLMRPRIFHVPPQRLAQICMQEAAGCYTPWAIPVANAVWLPTGSDDALLHELIHWRQYCATGVIDATHETPGVWCVQPECRMGRAQTVLSSSSG